jgi:hypothetical protein
LRVLPPPHVRVPEEQFLYPHTRTKRLYDGDPLDKHLSEQAKSALQESINDLRDAEELRELGMAIFLDRPFGGGKAPTEPDGTLLFSYMAFSRSIASNRIRFLAADLGLIADRAEEENFQQTLDNMDARGIPVKEIGKFARRGIVSLADALTAAEDFVVICNTTKSWSDFQLHYLSDPALKQFSMSVLGFGQSMLLLRDAPSANGQESVAIYDSKHRKRIELEFDLRKGYLRHRGNEFPASPLRLHRILECDDVTEQLRQRDLSVDPILLQPPRW